MEQRTAGQNRTLVFFCGLYCGDCRGYRGKVPDPAGELRKELRQSEYDRFAHFLGRTSFGRVFSDYDRCHECLGAMVKFRCRKGCRNGGGPPRCRIRTCCAAKGFGRCWECGFFETCSKLRFLEGVHGDAHLKNLQILLSKGIDPAALDLYHNVNY